MFNRYYESELRNLRKLSREFSLANPALAPMLASSSTDPDVERLLEGVAFLTGLTRQKLEDDFPEFTQELLWILMPHYLRGIPASTMVQFKPRNPLRETLLVKQGTELAAKPMDGTACRFTTTQDLRVHPMTLTSARFTSQTGAAESLVLSFKNMGVDFAQFHEHPLELFLNAGWNEATQIFEMLSTLVSKVVLHANGKVVAVLPAKVVQAGGFEHGALPYPSNAFPAYRLLQEYFALPEKCLFLHIQGLENLLGLAVQNFELEFVLAKKPDWLPEIHDHSLLLHVVPALNLFPHGAAPLQLSHKEVEYEIRPDGSNAQHYQTYSVESVQGFLPGMREVRKYVPFGAAPVQHSGAADSGPAIYHTHVRKGVVDGSAQTFISIPYLSSESVVNQTLSVGLMCTNGHLAEQLKYGDVCVPTSSSPEQLVFSNITPVRAAQDASSAQTQQWQLITHISMNLLSQASVEHLRSLLLLYLPADNRGQDVRAHRQRIEGVEAMRVSAESRLVGRHMMRGQVIHLQCRSDYFAGLADLYMFGVVMERFLAAYASINAYTRLELTDSVTQAVFQWNPRLGLQELL